VPEVRIAAEPRTEFGKGAARRERRAGRVPAVLYGHGTDTRHLTLPGHDVMMALKTANVLIRLDGLPGGNQLVLPKSVQRNPIRGSVEHVDLILVRRGEKVTVDVPLVLVGEPAPDTLVTVDHNVIPLEAEATHIPSGVELDIEGREVGTQILAKDLVLPEGSTLALDEDALIVNFSAAPTAEDLEAELAEAEAEAGIEHEPSDEELAATAEGGAAAEGEAGEAAAAGEGAAASSEGESSSDD
jgi:large subunit ribosomal protein L25